MRYSNDLVVDADAETVVDALADLSTYPEWNDLVSSAVRGEPHERDSGPAWFTTLKAQVGPFSRSKQLRFVRDLPAITSDLPAKTSDAFLDRSPTTDPVQTIRFIRLEVDGRDHARWTMEAMVEPAESSSKITLTLTYDGGLWIPALGVVLTSAIDRATKGLPSYLERRQGESDLPAEGR